MTAPPSAASVSVSLPCRRADGFAGVFWRKHSSLRVLRHAPRAHELREVVFAAGRGARPGELEGTERLAVDQGAGDLAVDVEVADPELAAASLDVAGRAGEHAARE